MAKCPFCGAEISTPVSYKAECPSCSRMIHSCVCCSFYSPSSHYGCKESVDELVWDKERSNFCDYFRLSEKAAGAKSVPGQKTEAEKSREKLAKLFDF
ncbi:MAG: hypothetical protein IKR80_04160 [Spirochaetales bacterium]|nr:hypothetical protein [Spirochaetales bacterium]